MLNKKCIIGPKTTTLFAIWIPDGTQEGMAAYFANLDIPISGWYSCADDGETFPLVAKFVEEYHCTDGMVCFFDEKYSYKAGFDYLVRSGAALYTIPTHGLPQTFSAIWLETMPFGGDFPVTANPHYAREPDDLWQAIAIHVLIAGRNAFDKPLYLHDGVIGNANANRWQLSNTPVTGDDYIVTLQANQHLEELEGLDVRAIQGNWDTHLNIRFYREGGVFPRFYEWFVMDSPEHTQFEILSRTYERFIAHQLMQHGLEGPVEFDETILPECVRFSEKRWDCLRVFDFS